MWHIGTHNGVVGGSWFSLLQLPKKCGVRRAAAVGLVLVRKRVFSDPKSLDAPEPTRRISMASGDTEPGEAL